MKKLNKIGLLFGIIYCVILLFAFISYPNQDNLMTGLIIHGVLGVDAVGRLTWTNVILIAVFQLILFYFLGNFISIIINRIKSNRI